MSWDENKVNALKELWTAGYTASQIAAKIGDVSRNAVIGKAHRLNLQTRAISKKSKSKIKPENKESENKKQKLMGRRGRFKAMLLDKSFPPEQPTKLLDLTDEQRHLYIELSGGVIEMTDTVIRTENYTGLVDIKNVMLMRGEVDDSSKLVNFRFLS